MGVTVLWPCTQGFRITDTWADHIARPGYNANYAGTDCAGPEQPLQGSQYSGKVLQAFWSTSGYGFTTFVEYSGVLRIRNAHQKDLGVKIGDTVTPDTYLGTMDSTGNSYGTHTHFETWVLTGGAWRNVDPLDPANGITLVSSPDLLQPIGDTEIPPANDLPEFPTPVIVKTTSAVGLWINLRLQPFTTVYPIIGKVLPGQEWEAYAMKTDYMGNIWYAVRRGDVIGWAAAHYNGQRWLEEVK